MSDENERFTWAFGIGCSWAGCKRCYANWFGGSGHEVKVFLAEHDCLDGSPLCSCGPLPAKRHDWAGRCTVCKGWGFNVRPAPAPAEGEA